MNIDKTTQGYFKEWDSNVCERALRIWRTQLKVNQDNPEVVDLYLKLLEQVFIKQNELKEQGRELVQ